MVLPIVEIIGTGRMGQAYGINLLRAGHPVLAHDVDPKASAVLVKEGAERVATLAEGARRSRFIITCLPKSELVEACTTGPDGILAHAVAGTTVIDMSTTSPETTVRMATALRERGVHFLDAPVSGHPERAKKGTLTIMVGGERPTFEEAREQILSKLGKHIFHTGGWGTGQAMKLVNNLIYNINRLAMCEGLTMGALAGIDPAAMVEVISLSSGASFALEKAGASVLGGDFQGGESALRLACKTLKLITDYGDSLGACLLLGNLAKQVYNAVGVKYGAELSPTAAIKFYEEIAKIEVRAQSGAR